MTGSLNQNNYLIDTANIIRLYIQTEEHNGK